PVTDRVLMVAGNELERVGAADAGLHEVAPVGLRIPGDIAEGTKRNREIRAGVVEGVQDRGGVAALAQVPRDTERESPWGRRRAGGRRDCRRRCRAAAVRPTYEEFYSVGWGFVRIELISVE